MPSPLSQLSVLVVDGQTTGASPSHGHLLELGWAVTRADADPQALDVRSHLLTLPQGATIPRPVARLTGISMEMLADAEPPERAWASLCDAVAGGGEPLPVIIHYARFELAFLRELHRRHGDGEAELPWRVVCTHEIARRLLPRLPRRGLRALAGFLGHGVDALKRSAEHVRATAFVWDHLVARLRDEHEVTTLEQLDRWLERPAPKPSAKRAYPMDRALRLALPDVPGVYRMQRKSGETLYVGKARSLRDRVNGYFRQHRRVPDRTLEMLTQAQGLDVTPTASALEAALLESDEIKALAPPYNVMLRGEGRTVWYATPRLDAWSEAPDRRHRRGPLGSRAMVEAWAGLAALDPEAPPPEAVARQCGFDESLDPAVWREGRKQFVEACLGGEPVVDQRGLAAAGALVWRAWREAKAEPESESEELDEADESETETETDVEAEARPWDPQRVAAALERILGLGAHELRRAAWMARLAHGCVVWTRPDERRRVLVLEAGRITRRADLDPGEPLPLVPGQARGTRPRLTPIELVTFDRLRVLTAELRRVLADGRDAWLWLGPRAPLDPERLRRALAWV